MPIIDVHSHPLLPVWRKAVARATNQPLDRLFMFGIPMPDWSVGAHVAAMDENGIDLTVLSLPGVANLAAGPGAADLCRSINEEMANIIAAHPGRFGAFAVLPLDDMDAAITEANYALHKLGLDGVGIGTGYAGCYLGDRQFDPLLAYLHDQAAVLFVHPGPPPGWKPSDDIDVSILEFMFDTTRMITNMILSGAKRRFDAIRIISTHGGGAIPYLAHRISILEPLFGAGWDRPVQTREEILAGLASFHFDLTASISPASLDALLHLVGPDRLLFGTDFPMMPARGMKPALDGLTAYEPLSATARNDILGNNAMRLLPNVERSLAKCRTDDAGWERQIAGLGGE